MDDDHAAVPAYYAATLTELKGEVDARICSDMA
jgi:hypothetical protein